MLSHHFTGTTKKSLTNCYGSKFDTSWNDCAPFSELQADVKVHKHIQ